MAQAGFIAGDPHRRAESKKKLRDPIGEMRGATDWKVDSGGRGTIENIPDVLLVRQRRLDLPKNR